MMVAFEMLKTDWKSPGDVMTNVSWNFDIRYFDAGMNLFTQRERSITNLRLIVPATFTLKATLKGLQQRGTFSLPITCPSATKLATSARTNGISFLALLLLRYL
jgi:hypothetical protein